MDHFPTNWGRPRNDAFDPYATYPLHQRATAKDTFAEGVQRTQQPIVTGTSVLGIKFKDGVMLAADNLASYGSLARFKDIQRLHPVGSSTVLGASGDMSDFQALQAILDDLTTDEFVDDDEGAHCPGLPSVWQAHNNEYGYAHRQIGPPDRPRHDGHRLCQGEGAARSLALFGS
ncbi:hypothetical protein NUW54_g6920 [Trametes sanguinea]|uniref:Uncharacterized protein n=1 Tax=Trametes sanguinea TaxID=158606 RepID=A0ACC1PSK1_9APHY|nr:hypothetical protein NUW54_g6920 [Trametes sanguinea]